MNESVILFDEPKIEFRYGQLGVDPRQGLGLYGPFDSDLPSKPTSLNYISIGTPSGLAAYKLWASAMSRPATFAPKDNFRIWVPYPGFEAAFGMQWPSQPVNSFSVDSDELLNASHLKDGHERAFNVVNFYLEKLRAIGKLDENIGVVICVVPDDVWQNCRPKSQVKTPIDSGLSRQQKVSRKVGQLELFESYDPNQYWLSPDFRRQLKARSMEFGIPIQIIRESTLRLSDENPKGQRQLTPLSDRMWNLGATLYYKCGGKPWRLVSAREGVCYIGLAFRRTDDQNTACCAAQMFLNTGDGVVFLGEYGPWYSPKTKQFHLDESAAYNLLKGVLETYRQLEGKELSEIFLHSRSILGEEEFNGFRKACPENVNLVGVRVRSSGQRGLKLFRLGSMPVMRGTFWKLDERKGLLWGSGFRPNLATYDGWEIPTPLQIDVLYGDARVERVAQDILGLTKLNYNSCKLGDAEPVTVGFSDAVGEILISNPRVEYRRPNFKFYI